MRAEFYTLCLVQFVANRPNNNYRCYISSLWLLLLLLDATETAERDGSTVLLKFVISFVPGDHACSGQLSFGRSVRQACQPACQTYRSVRSCGGLVGARVYFQIFRVIAHLNEVP